MIFKFKEYSIGFKVPRPRRESPEWRGFYEFKRLIDRLNRESIIVMSLQTEQSITGVQQYHHGDKI